MKVHLELFTANICSRCADAKGLLAKVIEDIADERCPILDDIQSGQVV